MACWEFLNLLHCIIEVYKQNPQHLMKCKTNYYEIKLAVHQVENQLIFMSYFPLQCIPSPTLQM